MTIEAGAVITRLGCLWHLPPGRSVAYLPDSPDLWQLLWDNRAVLEGFAHSHPGSGRGACMPSVEDITTFDAVERALGKRLRWWICSADCLVEYHRCNPDLLAYPPIMDWSPAEEFPHHVDPPAPTWVHVLREVSGHRFPMFECVGCGAPCEFGSREPLLGWGLEGGSVCPGPWTERRGFKTVAKACVYCDPGDEYPRTGSLPRRSPPPPPEKADLYAKLDAIASTAGTCRLVSVHRTDECPVWDPWKGLWTESDEQLRRRLTPKD